MLGAIFKFFFIGILAIAGVGLALGLVGVLFGIAMGLAVLALKLGVVAAIGYGAYRLFRAVAGPKTPQISAEDRKWLES
jgi:hypothetical protein